MKTLLIDNYDSFSHILFQYLWEVNGQEPYFIHNDEWTLDRIQRTQFDNILISPGPGRPDRINDFGICAQVMAAFPQVPLLGVCLGHQGLGFFAGAKIVPAPQVRHGKLSAIIHTGQGLFAGLPQSFQAMRYHSLVLEPTTDVKNICIVATSADDGQIMGIQLRDRPSYGLQFHPESIGTEGGRALLENFRDLTLVHAGRSPAASGVARPKAGKIELEPMPPKASPTAKPRLIEVRELPWREPESVFHTLFAEHPAAFWLDSQVSPGSKEPVYTYMGAGDRLIEIDDQATHFLGVSPSGQKYQLRPSEQSDPLEIIQRYLYDTETSVFPENCGFTGAFRGGLVGYFGYEVKRHTVHGLQSEPAGKDSLPDALFLEPDRVLAFDHAAGKVYAFLPVTADSRNPAHAETQKASLAWLEGLTLRWSTLGNQEMVVRQMGDLAIRPDIFKLPWKLSAEKEFYLNQIRNLQRAMLAGEAYEACLTNQVSVKSDSDPWLVYRLLRRTNPAPYSAFLRLPQGAILSASPERFLKLGKSGNLSSRPIKGTRKRGKNEEEDKRLAEEMIGNSKDRSENLMIVDLVRNDFGKVCEVGSVRVTESLVVESHPTVLQLVSGVEGKLRPGLHAIDAFRACFPGGSMTGAPKRRSMELLHGEERRARGVFSGALGYLGYDGAMDLGMVIRSLVYASGTYSIGCGGAILTESDPETEFFEAMLKAFAPMQALELAVYGECGSWKRGEDV